MSEFSLSRSAGILFVCITFAHLQQAGAAAPSDRKHCLALTEMKIAASRIALPTRGAKIVSAEIEHLAAGRTACVVKGAVSPVDSNAPDIQFQVNLPSHWNGRAVQFGGGGFDGALTDGRHVAYLTGARSDLNIAAASGMTALPAVDPVVDGYATFGSDSGHEWDPVPKGASGLMGAFALNDEALNNFAGAQLKKTHDAAAQIIKRFYGHAPKHQYFYGASQGGHEALIVAQRWPRDYDGIIAIQPAYNFSALMMRFLAASQRLYSSPQAWLSPAKTQLVTDAVLKTCDALDGVVDGLVSNVTACRKSFDARQLACPTGNAHDNCLSAAELATVEYVSQEGPLGYSSNGVSNFPGWPLLEGALPTVTAGAPPFGTKSAPDRPPSFLDAATFLLADQFVRYFVTRDPDFDSLKFNPVEHLADLQRVARLLDIGDPNLDNFRRRGGKVLLLHGTADMGIPLANTTAYYQKLQSRYGAGVSDFARFYVAVGFGHAAGPFFASWDSLHALEQWSEAGRPPGRQIVTDSIPGHNDRSRPLCEYPKWPKYEGVGSPDSADSFVCTSDDAR
jgi:hypothetical protein